jgi:hypothetical protein
MSVKHARLLSSSHGFRPAKPRHRYAKIICCLILRNINTSHPPPQISTAIMADSLATLEAKMRAQRKNKLITLMSRLLTPPSTAREPPSSPFILILDSLSMTGRHMRDEIINRFAYTSKTPINIIFVAWESPKFKIPEAVTTIIKPGTRPFEETQRDILKAVKPDQRTSIPSYTLK